MSGDWDGHWRILIFFCFFHSFATFEQCFGSLSSTNHHSGSSEPKSFFTEGSKAFLYILHNNWAFKLLVKQYSSPNPFSDKQPQTWTLVGCFTVLKTLRDPRGYHILCLFENRKKVDSSVKIAFEKSKFRWSIAHWKRALIWSSVRRGLPIGTPYLKPASASRWQIVLGEISTDWPFMYCESWIEDSSG